MHPEAHFMRKFSFPTPNLSLAAVSLALAGFVGHGQAQVVTLSDLNSSASIDLTNPNPALAGMFNWSLQGGPSQLRQQWFSFRVGLNPEQPISNLPLLSSSPFLGTRGLQSLYGTPGFTIEVDYLLTGGTFVPPGGIAHSDIQETIRIHNISGAPLDFHFFQYSDFDLAGPGNDSITLGSPPSGGGFNSANQTDGFSTLTESTTVDAPSANHGEAHLFNVSFNKLNDGSPDV